MDNERIKNTPLVSRDDIIKDLGFDGQVENLRETEFFENKKKRAEDRKFRLYRKIFNKIIGLSVSLSFVLGLGGVGAVYLKKIGDDIAKEDYMSQPMYDANEEDNILFDETKPYAPSNLLFEAPVYDIDGFEYKVVVNKQGECAFVDMNYETPFEYLEGTECKEMAERLGFDFNTLSNGRSR